MPTIPVPASVTPGRNRSVEPQPVLGIELLLQALQLADPPALVPVPVLHLLVSVRVVDVRVQLLVLDGSQGDVPDLLAGLHGLAVVLGAEVDDDGRAEDVVEAVGEGGGGRVDGLDALERVALEQVKGVVEGRLLERDVGELVHQLALGGQVVGLQRGGEAQRRVQAVLAGDALVAVARQGGDLRVVRLHDGRVDGAQRRVLVAVLLGRLLAALVQHVEVDDGLAGVDGRDAHVPDEVDELDRLRAAVGQLVGEVEHLLRLVLGEDQRGERPLVVRWHVVHLVLDLRHDAEVVARAPERPEEVRVLVGIGGHERAVGQDHARFLELVGGEAVAALQPAVASAQHGAEERRALARSGDGLLALGPQLICDGFRELAAADESRLAVRAEGEAVHLVHRDLDAVFHVTYRADTAVVARDRQPRETELVGELNLLRMLSSRYERH